MIQTIMRDMERLQKMDIKKTGSKLHLNIKFIAGPYKDKVIKCESSKDKIVFGGIQTVTAEEVEQLKQQNHQYIYIPGSRIVDKHFQLFFDPLQCGMLIQNLDLDCQISCGVYVKLRNNESF